MYNATRQQLTRLPGKVAEFVLFYRFLKLPHAKMNQSRGTAMNNFEQNEPDGALLKCIKLSPACNKTTRDIFQN